QQVAVLLVGGGLSALGQHANEARVNAARPVGEHALEEQVAGAAGGAMILQGVAVKVLVAVLDVETLELGAGAIPPQDALDPPLGELAAQLNGLQNYRAIFAEECTLGVKVVDSAAPMLDARVAEVGGLSEDELHDARAEALLPGLGRLEALGVG